jgi:CSLREA domain-containing protein
MNARRAMRLLLFCSPGRMPNALTLAIIAFLAAPQFASPATFVVNDTADANDGKPGDGLCETSAGNGLCTLRAAIEESNAVSGSSYDQIDIPPGTYRLTRGSLEIRASLFLTGNDQKTTFIDGNLASRVMEVIGDNRPSVYISDVTIQNGRGGPAVPGGGMVVWEGAWVRLMRTTVQYNRTNAPGGGIANSGTMQLVSTTVRGNVVPISGVGSTGGTQHSGGGVVNYSGATLNVIDSAIVENSASRGGGIRNFGGSMTMSNSTVSGNYALARGGGIMNYGTASISFSTITDNETDGKEEHPTLRSGGGGIYNDSDAQLSIGNSIVAGNRDTRHLHNEYSPDCLSVSPATITSFRGNLVGVDNANCDVTTTAGTGFDKVGTASSPLDPQLEPLADNGGPTPTHALLSNSPAIDEGTGVTNATFFNCPRRDQRFFGRPVDGNSDGRADCDIGAFESGAEPLVTLRPIKSLVWQTVRFIRDPRPGTLSIELTFTNSGPMPIVMPVREPFFRVVELSAGKVLSANSGGVGAFTHDGDRDTLPPGKSITTEFTIGLQSLAPFTLVVDALGDRATVNVDVREQSSK